MKRWHQDLKISLREWRKHRRIHVEGNKQSQYYYGGDRIGQDPFEVDCECDEQVGRFRKKDAYDCGHTRCYICHGDKLPKRDLTTQEIVSKLKFEEQLREL